MFLQAFPLLTDFEPPAESLFTHGAIPRTNDNLSLGPTGTTEWDGMAQ